MRYPFAPIEALLGHPGSTAMAERFGVEAATVRKWRSNGLAERTADRVAVVLGLTPHLIVGWEHYEEAL